MLHKSSAQWHWSSVAPKYLIFLKNLKFNVFIYVTSTHLFCVCEKVGAPTVTASCLKQNQCFLGHYVIQVRKFKMTCCANIYCCETLNLWSKIISTVDFPVSFKYSVLIVLRNTPIFHELERVPAAFFCDGWSTTLYEACLVTQGYKSGLHGCIFRNGWTH